MFTKFGGVYRVKLIDFGITKPFSEEQNLVKEILSVSFHPISYQSFSAISGTRMDKQMSGHWRLSST